MFGMRAMVRSLGLAGIAALSVYCAPAQTLKPTEAAVTPVDPLVLNRTQYRLRAGESVRIDAPPETVDFLVRAKSRRVEIDGKEARGIVIGPDVAGDQILLAASLLMKPGTYTLEASAIGTVANRKTTLQVTVDTLPPVPSAATQPPAVLLNGWQIGLTTSCPVGSNPFEALEQNLLNAGVPTVYFFDNCAECPNCPLEQLGSILGQFVSMIQFDSGVPVPKIDLVAHSMGGLIARSYLAGLQSVSGAWSFLPPTAPPIRKLVQVASPNFGSFLAANNSLLGDLGTQSAEMIPGSVFLWELNTWNQGTDDLRGVDALAIVGNQGTWSNGGLGQVWTNASDGVVSINSASLSFAREPSRTLVVPYCHIDSASVPGAFIDCTGSAICEAPPTLSIVQFFLFDNPTWATLAENINQAASTYGGVFVGVQNSVQQYLNDFTQAPEVSGDVLSQNPQDVIFYGDFLPAGQGIIQFSTVSLGSLQAKRTVPLGTFAPLRIKVGPFISGVTPLQQNTSQIVATSGATITVSGYGFGSQCSGCQLLASGNALQISSWTDSAISAYLPAFAGAATITVQASTGSDAFNIMAAPASAIAVSPTSLQFAYTMGGAVPSAQSIQVTNSGGGTLSWGASTDASWLNVSPLSGVAPSTVSLSISSAGLGAGTYTGSVQISAAGATNSPVSVTVTLVVSAAPAFLAVSPQALTFNYTVGGAVPGVQSVSITNGGSGLLLWTASASTPWVTLSPASGRAPDTLSVSVNPSTMAAGTYAATVQITAAGANGSPASVGVTLTVQTAAPPFTVALSTAGQVEPFAVQAIVSAYGANLASGTASAVTVPLPTSLDNTTVTVTDSAAVTRLASLFYVSPVQVNFEIPAGTASGTASVSIQNQNETAQSATIQIGNVSPGLFQLNSSGLVAAWVLPVISGTQQPLQPVYQIASGSVVPLPIILGPSSAQVYLEMYGTGIRNADNVTATVGGLNVPVLFAGAAPGFAGEDQVNIGPLPDALAGKGNVNIVLTADGQAANMVNVTIQ